MSWRAKLQAQRQGAVFLESRGDPLTELTQPGFVGFVSDPPEPFENIAPDSLPLAGTAEPARFQPLNKAKPAEMPAHLLELAGGIGLEPETVNAMPLAELNATAQQLAEVLAANGPEIARRFLKSYLLAWRDTAERQAGRVPADDTAAIHCQGCGPVWVHPSIAHMLPTVAGWPRALGCSWCVIRKAGGYVPRPKITCGECQHFTPDTINPPAGMGDCRHGHHGSPYPMQRRACSHFEPIKDADT